MLLFLFYKLISSLFKVIATLHNLRNLLFCDESKLPDSILFKSISKHILHKTLMVTAVLWKEV